MRTVSTDPSSPPQRGRGLKPANRAQPEARYLVTRVRGRFEKTSPPPPATPLDAPAQLIP